LQNAHRVTIIQECDATTDDSSNAVDIKK